MNAANIYGLTCEMLKAYDLHTGNAGAESVIRDPHAWTNCGASWLSIYHDAAEILVDCLQSMEKKTTGAQTLAAVNRIIKSAPEHYKGLQGIFTNHDIPGYYLCNGNLLIMLKDDIKGVQHVPDEVNTFKVKPLVDEIGAATGDKIKLPTIAQLKAFQKAEAARGYRKARGYKDPRPVCIGDYWFCNPQLLIDILTILPGAEAIKPETWIKPMYFHSKNGCAMLLPVRPRDDYKDNEQLRQELRAA